MKNTVMVLLTMVTACSLAFAAGGSQSQQPSGSTVPGKTYNGQDVSKPVELVMYFLGDMNTDANLVLGEINKVLKEKINAALSIKNISLSDYQTKYSLTIAGGEKYDLMYTSTWAYYQTEANKGAFVEVTNDVLNNYMPLTKQNQDPASFAQARIAGKTYFVPVNMANVSANALVIRGDLREKYGLPKIGTIADLEAFYRAVARDRNSGVAFAFNASQNNDIQRSIQFFQKNSFVELSGSLLNYFTYKYSSNISVNDLVWIYSTPEYKEWANRMKSWADMGAWSRSAIANATDVRDSFINGNSAAAAQNLGTVGAVASQIQDAHPEWKPELVDVSAGTPRFYLAYTGDGIAIMANSQNQARAFMALDLLKFDETLNILARNGIEGTHYINEGNKLWSKGPSFDNWPFGNAFSWGLKNIMYEMTRSDTFPDQIALSNEWNSRAMASPTASFSFDDSAVQNELANLQSVYIQYIPLLDLGLAPNVDAALAEFQKQAEAAGINKIFDELKRQFAAHLETLR
jgi:putative aldouronate transport system substrate-binding protein